MEISIGKKIRAWRKERNMTQVQLANAASISRSYLASVEIDRYNPSVDTLKAIAAVLNIPVSFLLEDTNIEDEPGEKKSPAVQLNSEGDPVIDELFREVLSASPEDRKKILEIIRVVKGNV